MLSDWKSFWSWTFGFGFQSDHNILVTFQAAPCLQLLYIHHCDNRAVRTMGDLGTTFTTLQELDDLLGEYDLKRDLVEINRKAPQWFHNAVWNKRYMEPRPGFALQQLWANSESAITQKTSPSYEVKDNDIRRAVWPLQPCQLLHCLRVHSSWR